MVVDQCAEALWLMGWAFPLNHHGTLPLDPSRALKGPLDQAVIALRWTLSMHTSNHMHKIDVVTFLAFC